MPKRANGEGSIFQVGKFYRAAYTSPAGKRVTKQFKTRAAASEHLNQQLNDINRGGYVESNNLTVAQWLFIYTEQYARPRLTVKSYETLISLVRHFKTLADITLQQLTNHAIQTQLNAMTGKGYSAQTVTHAKNLIFGALKQAVRNRIVLFNAADGLSLPRIVKPDIVIFTPDEIKQLIENSRDNKFGLVIEIAAVTGMRQGEILGLRVCDVGNNTLSINQTVQTCRAGRVIGQPKTASSRRKIAIPASTAARIADHIDKEKPSDLLITTSNGNPIAAGNFIFWFNKLQETLEIPHRKFHNIRHSHSSYLLNDGVQITEICRRLGHSRPSFTFDVYSHCIKDVDSDIADKISEIYQLDK